jgi:hypothetical protein
MRDCNIQKKKKVFFSAHELGPEKEHNQKKTREEGTTKKQQE